MKSDFFCASLGCLHKWQQDSLKLIPSQNLFFMAMYDDKIWKQHGEAFTQPRDTMAIQW